MTPGSRKAPASRVRSARERRGWLVALGALVIAAVGAAAVAFWFSGNENDGPASAQPSASSPASPSRPARNEGLPYTGTASVDVGMKVFMPEDFDGGVPRRTITGGGVLDLDADSARVELDMSGAPNSAGFFGHVDGDMTVVYEESHFMITFPILARVLEGKAKWLRYEFFDLAEPRAAELGIGQLREVGLSDPRLGLALASTYAGEPREGDVIPIDTTQAANRVPLEYVPIVGELRRLGIEDVELEIQTVEDGVPTAFGYRLAYPPALGSKNVRLDVSVQLSDLDGGQEVRLPAPGRVRSYADHINL